MEGDISFEEFVEIRAQEQYEIGLEKGREEGEARGRAAGRAEERAEILKVLGISEDEYQKKFKAKTAQ